LGHLRNKEKNLPRAQERLNPLEQISGVDSQTHEADFRGKIDAPGEDDEFKGEIASLPRAEKRQAAVEQNLTPRRKRTWSARSIRLQSETPPTQMGGRSGNQ